MSTFAELDGGRVETSARAGISGFGGGLSLRQTLLSCNLIDLDVEPPPNMVAPIATLEDLGGDVCTCGSDIVACASQSTGIEPPSALAQ